MGENKFPSFKIKTVSETWKLFFKPPSFFVSYLTSPFILYIYMYLILYIWVCISAYKIKYLKYLFKIILKN